ncbi:MAG: sulfur-carrier protein adenylyltransferase/sulfurtransferase [Thermoplasmata archaeon]|jgi:adenylyltransferase/sulfurtransferase|nr:sulfur-carrier protein adenylyltransferase/sulfurtransferase [Thermoplasmata archaeon]
MDDARFARQLPVIGADGQRRLREGKVLVVGMGGLGCPAALYLAGAGVGTLGLMDFDRVEASNLHRQVLYAAADVGRPKVEAARDRLLALAPSLQVRLHPEAFRAGASVAGYDLVLSCTDDTGAQYALSDACRKARIPLVHAAVSSWEGELAVFLPGGPCLRCLRPTPTQAPSCADEGVLGPVPGVLGAMQALEAIKLLVGLPAAPGLLLWDGRGQSFDGVALKRREGCACGVSQQEDGPACPLPWNAPEVTDIPVHELAPRLGQFFLLDVREPEEHEEFALPHSLLVPLGQLPRRLAELPKDRPIAVYCAVGGRSARATDFLRAQGFNAVNVRGGMRAWWLMTHQ